MDWTQVDLKKTDYTLRDWDDTDDLIEEIEDSDVSDDEVVEVIEEHGAGLRPVMHLIGRTSGGSPVHVRVHGIKPYFYVPYEEFNSDLEKDSKVTGHKKGFENIHGEQMVKVFTRIPGDVPKLRGEYDHYEADILFPNRFLIDQGIEGSFKIPSKHATSEPTDITTDDIRESDIDKSTRVCFCDIEVDDSKGFPDQEKANREVISITVYDNFREDYQIFLYHPDLPEVSHEFAKIRMYEKESDMLKAFSRYIKLRDFNVITGWNFEDFDSRYILNRMERLSDSDAVEDLSKNDVSKLDSAYDEGYFGAKIKGLAVFDMLRAYKNLQFSELDSYRLEDVAQEELGEGKVDHQESLYELWQNNVQKLVDYNIKDVKLTVDLEKEQDIIKFYEEIANYVGGRLSEVVDASKAVDIKVLRAVNGQWAVPSAKNVDGEEFEGATVFDPAMGIKENVVVLDLASLYPMSMKTINAGPETKDPEGELVAPNGIRFSNEEDAIVVEIIDEMLEERQKYKDLRDEHHPDSKEYAIFDRKQTAVKIVMNTLYGVLGWDRFRLQDKDVGAAVTAVGRACIEFTEKVVEEMGYEVVYGDTDSVMVHLGPGYSKEEVKEIGFELEEKINKAYDHFAKEELNADEHFFDIEFEKLYRRFFQAGKKKRYAGYITWKEGKDKDDIDIVGFEYKRSDYSKASKELMERVFEHLLTGGGLEDISNVVNDVISKLRNEEYDPDEFGIPASVTKDFSDYDTETTAVKGSKYANEHFDAEIQSGDKPKMHYVERVEPNEEGNIPYPMPDSDSDRVQPCCWMDYNDIPDCVVWDWDKYIEVQIIGPLERILKGTDWTWSEVISGDRQPKLGEYEFEKQEGEAKVIDVKSDTPTGGAVNEFEDDNVPEDEIEAKKALAKTQDMLDSWEEETEDFDESEVVEASMKSVDTDGPVTLDNYLEG